MRNAVVDGQFEHLRIDHDQPALVRAEPVDQAQDHGVDGDRFARAGGAGDQEMRHAGEIDDHRLAADRLAEAERQLGGRVVVVFRRQQLAQIDLLARRIGQLDADRVAARHHGDARRYRAHRARYVVGQPDHARRLDAGRGFELVERDDRARPRVDDLAAHAEIVQHAFERGGVLLQRFRAGRKALDRLGGRQQPERGQHVTARGLACGRTRRGSRRLGRRDPQRPALAVLVLILVVLVVVRGRFGLRHDPRLDPRAGCAALRRAECEDRRERTRDVRLETQESMHEPADRDRDHAHRLVGGLILFGMLVVVIGLRMESETGRDPDHDERRQPERHRDDQARRAGQRATRHIGGQAQQAIADHAAETGRQRPGGGAREARRESGRERRAHDPQREPQALAVEPPMGEQTPAPECDRQHDRDRGETEQLHQQVGRDRAPRAEQIAHRRAGGVAQARILHRPGRERGRRDGRNADQREPDNSRTRRRRAALKSSGRNALASKLRWRARWPRALLSDCLAHVLRDEPISGSLEHGLPEHGHDAMQRLGRGFLVMHHGDADVVRAGIAAVGLIAREIAAGQNAHAGLSPQLSARPRCRPAPIRRATGRSRRPAARSRSGRR